MILNKTYKTSHLLIQFKVYYIVFEIRIKLIKNSPGDLKKIKLLYQKKIFFSCPLEAFNNNQAKRNT